MDFEFASFVVGPFETNVYIIGSSTSVGVKAAVIDPGIDCEGVWHYLQRKGWLVECLINTHAHLDHTYGNHFMKEVTGAPLLIHEQDAPWLARVPQEALAFGLAMPQVAKPDRLLKDNDRVEVGEVEFRVIHTPGHTPGGICLYRPGVIFVGDTLFAGSIGRTDLPGGSYSQLLSSIQERLLPLPGETVVYCGHGPATTIGEEKRFNPFLS